MKIVTIVMLLTLLLIANPSLTYAQDVPGCDPAAIAQEYQSQIATASTLEALTDASNQLEVALMTCRYAGSEIGLSRTNPVPAGNLAQITDAFSISIRFHVNITQWLVSEDYDVEDGMVYYAVFFTYQCDLPPDQLCEGYQTISSLVSESGNVYDYEIVGASDYEYSWELYGGASKDLYGVFAVNETDTENFVVRFEDNDENYNKHTRFFSPGEEQQMN